MTFEKVKEIILYHLVVDEEKVTLESNLAADLGADSLEIVEIVSSIEDCFNLEIPDEVYDNLLTVGDIVHYIDSVI